MFRAISYEGSRPVNHVHGLCIYIMNNTTYGLLILLSVFFLYSPVLLLDLVPFWGIFIIAYGLLNNVARKAGKLGGTSPQVNSEQWYLHSSLHAKAPWFKKPEDHKLV